MSCIHPALSACPQRGGKGFGLSVTSNCPSQGFLITLGMEVKKLPEVIWLKKGHVPTCEDTAGSTLFLLSPQAASPFIPFCDFCTLPLPSVLPAGMESPGDKPSACHLLPHPSLPGAAGPSQPEQSLPPTATGTSGLSRAEKSSGISVAKL